MTTVQAAKRLYPSRLRAWNFASHMTFLRGFCEEVAWVLRGISVSFAKFCEIFFRRALKASVKQLNCSVERNVKRIKTSEKKIIFLLKPIYI